MINKWIFYGLLMAMSGFAGEFEDHGIAAPVSSSRGLVMTKNGQGEDVVLCLPTDSLGVRSCLVVNADTGKYHSIALPNTKNSIVSNSPFASLLSSKNRYYTICGGRFYEIDPEKNQSTFDAPITDAHAFAMVEAKDGTIYAALSPRGHLIGYNPSTGNYTTFGPLWLKHGEGGARFAPKTMIAGDDGWLYIGMAYIRPEILAFNPATRETRVLIPDTQARRNVSSFILFAATDGHVYGKINEPANGFFAMRNGTATPVRQAPNTERKSFHIAAGTQNLFYQGENGRLLSFDLLERKMTVKDGQKEKIVPFDYTSNGAHIMAIAAMSDGTLRGGTAFPMRYFTFEPSRKSFTERGDATYQWNVVTADGDNLWIGGYPKGAFIRWNIRKPFTVITKKIRTNVNPALYGLAAPTLNRPSSISILPGGRFAVMAGTPGYQRTGGGLAIVDLRTQTMTTIFPKDLLGEFSVSATIPISETQIIGGATSKGGTGGKAVSAPPPLFIYDLPSRKIIWQATLLEKVKTYVDFLPLPKGKILGATDTDTLFIFDITGRKIEKVIPTVDFGPIVLSQGSRSLLTDGKRIFVLLRKSIAEFDLNTGCLKKLADSPVWITAGGAVSGGRIWFGSHASLWSYRY